MPKAQKNAWLVIGLSAIFLVVLVRAVRMIIPGRKPPGADRSIQGVQRTIAAPSIDGGTPLVVAEAPRTEPMRLTISGAPMYTAGDRRDPMESWLPEEQPVAAQPNPGSAPARATAPPPMPQLQVQGTLWGGPHPSVIINHEVYGIGDSVQGVTIKDVTRDGLTVEFQGRTQHLALSNN